ncbi:hypothetical protein RGQ29_002483 [Quercus rubra]|uniref:Uncharacterized protein n=1 Tax=Quercus rubra TaxID=3512 RepID=A0AAN7IDR9_QUERU|nr:hypothetical protein RGQ29_002483 [Quercus rubra]
MAGIVVDDIVDRLVDNVFSLATEHIGPEPGFKEELRNLLDTLYKIKAVLPDAQKRQVSDDSVRIWFTELRDVAYEGDDVLDEFGHEILRQKLETKNQMMDQVCSFLLSNPNRVKSINQSLGKIVNDVAHFDLRMEFMTSIPKIILDKNMDSLLNDSEVVGRAYDVVKIVNLLTSSSNQHVISVLPIVGMAGLGKSTLAKLVYNHEIVQKHFDVLTWVCVTENFDVGWILREILKSLDKFSVGLNAEYAILRNLKKILWGKKFLLILDDVWDVDHVKWDSLQIYLTSINSRIGSNIVVTTRSEHVAEFMETIPRHHLERLSKDECWSIFKNRAFANERIMLNPSLEAIGREIAKRCGGVPLFASILGGIMCFTEAKIDLLLTQHNKIPDLLDDSNGIFPVFQFSFDHLPTPSLKKCFAYCAMFPKYYTMEKEELIQLWMAEGFLQPPPRSEKSMEDIGDNYFDILVASSLLQDVEKDMYGNIAKCKMHYLLHELALLISKPETLMLMGNFVDNISHVRRLYVPFNVQVEPRILFTRDGVANLRTFISEKAVFGNKLSSFKSLRVLKLFGSKITELPDSIGSLIHLRLLSITHSVIEVLPKSTMNLYYLQTLRIKNCHSLKELPDISNLINLRHLYIDHNDIKQTPKDIGKLSCLQSLSCFVVHLDAGCQIGELGGLNQLRGELDIFNLEYVRDKEEAKKSYLAKKMKLYKLGFYWSNQHHKEKDDNYCNDEVVLEGLQPHQNLKSLTICGFGGDKFPSWMLTCCDAMHGLALFDNLIEINLEVCQKCEVVPTLGHLPCLRVLKMVEMDNVRCIGIEFYINCDVGSSRNAFFPALRRFEMMSMHKLLEWKDAVGLKTVGLVFACLEKLSIIDCGQLTIGPFHFPSLQKLEISNISSMAFENISSELSTLTSLWICEVSKLRFLPERLLQNNTSLMSIHIENCPELVNISPHDVWAFCTSLRSLKLDGCEELRYLPIKLHTLRSLEVLEVRRCSNLRSFPSIQGVVSLLILRIQECPNLISIPNLRELHSLVELRILYCGRLTHLPEGLDELSLKYLSIGGFCDELDAFPSLNIQHLNPQLEWLSLYGWANINLPNEIQCFTALRKLCIRKFDEMIALPEWLGNLYSLQKLSLKECKNLMCLPLQFMQRLTKLEWLVIHFCPNLRERCVKGSGADWPKINHIPNIKVDNELIKWEAV